MFFPYRMSYTIFKLPVSYGELKFIPIYRKTFHFLEKSAARIDVNSKSSSVIYFKVYIHKESLTSLFQG